VVAVAAAHGFDVAQTGASAKDNLGKLAPTMKASMARDFERGRPTELDSLTGAVVRLGQARQVPTPASRVLYAILKLRASSRA
jgi:2-dehydropantoate 2-reductase